MPYAYGYDVIKVPKMNESLIADQMIEENFTKSNLVALVYPKSDDYSIEKKMLEELESYDEIDSTKGLSNIEAQDGYKLVVADLTIKNTETYSMPMGQYDFMIAWGDGDEDFAYPLNQYCESQLADEYEIPIAGSAEGSLVFEVPSDQKDFALGFEEYYEDESVGDLYVVYFTAE